MNPEETLNSALRAYRNLTFSLIRSFIPKEKQENMIKLLSLIEKDPDAANRQMQKLQEINQADEKYLAQDRIQAAWQAGTKKDSSKEDEKRLAMKKRMSQAKGTYNHIGSKPDWLMELASRILGKK